MAYIEKTITISSSDTDTDVLNIPGNKIGHIVQIEIRNPNSSTARVRIWDEFTDTNGTSHKELKLDWDIAATNTEVIKEGFRKHAFGKLVAQSTVADVILCVRVELE